MFFVIDLHRFGLFEFSNWMKVLPYGTKSIRWEISNDRSVSETQQAVGPALTFAFREAVFALVMMENELFPQDECSNLISVLEEVMVRHPEHWENYYRGKYEQCAYKRKYSLSDRVRYYWPIPKVQLAFERLLKNLGGKPLPLSLVSQFLPVQYAQIRAGELDNEPRAIIWDKINNVLDGYAYACG